MALGAPRHGRSVLAQAKTSSDRPTDWEFTFRGQVAICGWTPMESAANQRASHALDSRTGQLGPSDLRRRVGPPSLTHWTVGPLLIGDALALLHPRPRGGLGPETPEAARHPLPLVGAKHQHREQGFPKVVDTWAAHHLSAPISLSLAKQLRLHGPLSSISAQTRPWLAQFSGSGGVSLRSGRISGRGSAV